MLSLSWERSLHEFCVAAFDAEEMRRWVFFHCRAAYDDLPRPPAPTVEVAFAFVRQATRLGLLDDSLLDQLLARRPERSPEIEEIRAAWRGARHIVPRTAAPPPEAPIADLPSHTAITLDRVGQWRDVLTGCAGPEHLLIIVHGDREQDLDLFLARIKVFVDKECPRRHHEFFVDFTRDRSDAVTADDWARRVCAAARVRTTHLGLALAQAARTMAALFVLEDAGRPLRGLAGEHFAGFAEFFGRHVPHALTTHPPDHPLRFVLPIEHADDGGAVRDALKQLVRNLRSMETLRVLQPKELAFPTLAEVRQQLHAQYPDLDPAAWERCARHYREVTDRTRNFRRTLRHLADPIDEILTDWLEQRAGRPRPGSP